MIEAMSHMDEKMNVIGTTPSTEGTSDLDTAEIRRMFNMGAKPTAKKGTAFMRRGPQTAVGGGTGGGVGTYHTRHAKRNPGSNWEQRTYEI